MVDSAVETRRLRMIQYLLEYHYLPTFRDTSQDVIILGYLVRALKNGSLSIVQHILEKCPDIEISEVHLGYAIMSNSIELTNYLLKKYPKLAVTRSN